MFTRKPVLQLRKIVITSAKRLLQQCRHVADIPSAPAFVRYWVHSGHWQKLALNGLVANDPERTYAHTRSIQGFAANAIITSETRHERRRSNDRDFAGPRNHPRPGESFCKYRLQLPATQRRL